jgi:hypothetical protein
MIFKKITQYFLIGLCLVAACKPKQKEESVEVLDFKLTKSIGFTVTDSIPVYKEYKLGSSVYFHLTVDSQVKLNGFFKTKYQGILLDWIGIKTNETTGYIPGSYLTKKGLSVFNALDEKKTGMITASYLRVREKPSLTANVITQVPRGSTVTILMEGLTLQTIEDRTDKWVQVQTRDGKIGFSFKGFIQEVFEKDLSETDSGYIELTGSEIKYWKNPGWILIPEPIKDNSDDICRLSLKAYPKAGAILNVSAKAIIDSKAYYKMDHHNPGCDNACPCGHFDFDKTWFSEEHVKYISEADISNYTLAKYEKQEHIDLLKEYAKMRNNSVNFSHVKVLERKFKTLPDVENEIFEVRDEYANSVRVFSKKDNKFKFLLGGNICNSYSYEDIDTDGVLEVIESSGGWNGSSDSYTNKVFYSKKGIYENIFEYNTLLDYEYRIEEKFENSKLILSHYKKNQVNEKYELTEKEDLELTQIYTFKNGNFTLTKEIKKKE